MTAVIVAKRRCYDKCHDGKMNRRAWARTRRSSWRQDYGRFSRMPGVCREEGHVASCGDSSSRELHELARRQTAPAAVDARLNPLLSKLRRVFGSDVVSGRSTLRLCLPDARVDLESAIEAIHRAESAVAQHDWVRAWGPVLGAPFRLRTPTSSPARFPPWIDEIRHQLTVLRLRALECYAATELGIAGPQLAGAVRAGRQLVRLAPLRESGYRYLMQALAAQDNVAEALHIYGQLCASCLRDQYRCLTPAPLPAKLYERLLAAA